MGQPELLAAIERAVAADPSSVPLRIHLATLLLDAGEPDRAVGELGTVLAQDPANDHARQLLQRALSPESPSPAVDSRDAAPSREPSTSADSASVQHADQRSEEQQDTDLDWSRLEAEVGISIDPPFVGRGSRDDEDHRVDAHDDDDEYDDEFEDEDDDEFEDEDDGLIRIAGDSFTHYLAEPEGERVTLDDVGGLEHVKKRLRLAFLEPMRNPEIAKAYGKSLRGGLVLYGPPGTGKTYLARAVAGELDARFMSISIADILDGVIGRSEKNVQLIFHAARELAPCVLFIDELDSLGGKRSMYSNVGWMRNVVNQILQEMDGVRSSNEGVFILGATNHPWDVDQALLRPGRFDRMLFVSPPDAPARHAILQSALKDRPIAGIHLDSLVVNTEGFSGADLTHLVSSAAEIAMSDSLTTGEIRPISMTDFQAALQDVRPSTLGWMQSARNVVDFANGDGRYDELSEYLDGHDTRPRKRRKR